MEPHDGSPTAHEKPQRVEELYHLLIDLTGVARIVLDVEGRLLDANAEYLRLTGRERLEELVGRRIVDWARECDRPRVHASLALCLENGFCRGLAYELLRPDGSRVPVECSALVVAGPAGRRVLAICKDMSRQRAADREVSDLDARLAAFLETAVDGIVTIDVAGTIETFNPAAERMFGYGAAEVIGRNIKTLMPPPYHDEHDGYLRRYAETGERHIIGVGREVLGLRKDGSVFPLNLSVAEMRIDGQRKFSGLLHDLTDRKQLEGRYLQAQKMEAVGRLASGIAHDFNNLLMGIQGCCRVAASELDPAAPALVQVQEILDAAGRGTALTRQLLAFSRNRDLEPRPILVNEALASARVMLRHLLGEDVQLEIEFAPLGGPIVADEGQIEQILMNLAVNSRDAMPSGGRLRIRAEELDSASQPAPRVHAPEPGRWVLLEVEDTGIGMDQATLARAFEPFFTTKPEGKGTGLGLATTYGIVRQLEGHIELESAPGAGTRVRMFLPRRDGGPAPAPRAVVQATPAAGSLTVLLVEDDRLVRAGVRHLLQSRGHRVLDAEGADAALALCQSGVEVDLLLTDIVMPDRSGPELAREFRQRFPKAKVLFMSAFSGELLVEQGRLVAGEPTIEKPFSEEQLALAIRALFD